MINTKRIDEREIDGLYELIASVNTKEDVRALFDDLCTVKEIEQMAQRVKAAQLLLEGYTYAQVMEHTDISSATLSRVSRCIQYGQGYSRLLKQDEKKQ